MARKSSARRPSNPQARKRDTPHKLTFFNHKGGVGKTIITANVCFALAELGYSVLAVDADPQCNLSTYLLESSVLARLLDTSETAKGATLWSAVRRLQDASGDVSPIAPVPTKTKNLHLLVGDIRLAAFEEALAQNWQSLWARSRLALRQFTAIAEVVAGAVSKTRADFVLFDVGPNIGALNRSVLLNCDSFVVPVLRDVFSRRALVTLGRTIAKWSSDWESLSSLLPESAAILRGHPMLGGYVVGDYTSHPGLNKSYSDGEIQADVSSQLVQVLRKSGLVARGRTLSSLRLGSVGNHGPTIVEAIERNASIWRMPGQDAERARKEFFALTKRLTSELPHG